MNPLSSSLRFAAAFILSFGLSISFSAQAEIYKWVDSEGNTHYSQTPPRENKTKVEDIASDIAMAAGTSSSSNQAEDAETKEKDEMAQARADGKKNQLKHQTVCKQQKGALKQLLANPVIKWKAGDEERILTAKERTAKIAEFEKNIKDLCDPKVLARKEKVGVN